MSGLKSIVLKPGPVWRVDPGPDRLGHGTGPGVGQNPVGNWPGQTRLTRDLANQAKPDQDAASNPLTFIFFVFFTKTMSF